MKCHFDEQFAALFYSSVRLWSHTMIRVRDVSFMKQNKKAAQTISNPVF